MDVQVADGQGQTLQLPNNDTNNKRDEIIWLSLRCTKDESSEQ